MEIIGLGNTGQGSVLTAMRTAYTRQAFTFFFARSGSEEEDHSFFLRSYDIPMMVLGRPQGCRTR